MKTVNVRVKLTIEGHEVGAAVPVPAGRTGVRGVLEVLQRLTDVVVTIAEQRVVEEGRAVSCKKGCGACCRQMVPVSPGEAFALLSVVEAMEPRRQKRVATKFSAAAKALGKGGVLALLRRRDELSGDEQKALDVTYFQAQVACPFLEDESCSIHTDRPLACREYLVTSPAEFCARPTGDRVMQVPLGAKVSAAVREVEGAGWVPLVLALEFARASTEKVAGTGPELMRGILEKL